MPTPSSPNVCVSAGRPGHLGDLRRRAGARRCRRRSAGRAAPRRPRRARIDGQRPLDREARLVRQDRHRHAGAQARQLGRDRRAGSAARRTRGRTSASRSSSRFASARRPGAVRVDAQARPVADGLAHRSHARLVLLRREPDLEVERAEARPPPAGGRPPPSARARRARGRRGSRSASARRRPRAGAAAARRARPCRSQSAVSMPDSAHEMPCVPRCAIPVSAYSRRRIEVVVERVGADHERRHRLDQRASSPRRCRPTPRAPRRSRSGRRR